MESRAGLSAKELNPNYGNGRHAIGADDPLLVAQLDLDRRIDEAFSSPRYRPPVLPAVAVELMSVANSPDVNVRAVVALLEKDPVLATGVLKLVRSPLHRGTAEVRSLKEAVVRLGLQNVRDVALEAAMNARIFRSPLYSELMADLAMHSRATAHVARIVCRYVTWDAEYAFLCGLIHDVGIVSSLLVLNELPRGSAQLGLDVVVPSVVHDHEQRAELVARAWGMPDEVVWVIGHHHHLRNGTHVHPLSAIICVAEFVATRMGFAPFKSVDPRASGGPLTAAVGHDETPPMQMKLAVETLGLSKQAFYQIVQDAQRALPTPSRAAAATAQASTN
ncbi:MAG: HDOD domain-containing protein [Deltaproteobacteria bacterium]|nr:HDOD domain-containing protein [Deltaproteobacteria bacterium]MCB9787925.1 HDOD domain-containing protein [Deltaproteobacteria bacterium]